MEKSKRKLMNLLVEKEMELLRLKRLMMRAFFWFDTISYAEDDPMCCPSIKGEAKYKLHDGKLNPIEE